VVSAAFAVLGPIAACGDDPADDAADGGPDGRLPDGAILGPDGEIIFPDGALPDGALPDGALPDGGDPDAADGGEDADAGPGVDSGPLSLGYVDYAINQILSTGQSNSVASGARPSTTIPRGTIAITNSQPYTNLMFNTGVMTSQNCGGAGCPTGNYVAPTSFVPLVEGDSFFGGTYFVETASSAMANLISRQALDVFGFGSAERPTYPTKHDVMVSLHGRSGNKYVCLRKTAQTDPTRQPPPSDCALSLRGAFSEGMLQVQAAHDLAVAAGKSHVVRAVTVIHGESDHNGQLGDFPMRGSDGTNGKIKNYTDALVEWQEDYEAGVKAITNQTEPVPLFVMALSGWTGPGPYGLETTSPRYSPLLTQQYNAHVAAPGKVYLVAPGYIIDQGTQTNVDTSECLHQSIIGQRQIGEYFAKAYAKVVLRGERWEPVRPKTIARAGAVVTVEYHVPVPPLTLDTTLVTNRPGPDENDYGFEYRVGGHTGTRIGIASVVVSGPTTVTITLDSVPAGGDQRLIYGQNQPALGTGCTGPGVRDSGGARGNLRDSDPAISNYNFPLYNWGVAYDLPVP